MYYYFALFVVSLFALSIVFSYIMSIITAIAGILNLIKSVPVYVWVSLGAIFLNIYISIFAVDWCLKYRKTEEEGGGCDFSLGDNFSFVYEFVNNTYTKMIPMMENVEFMWNATTKRLS